MIKIIKQGCKGKTKRIYEHECIICGCVFEFEEKDTDYNNYNNTNGIECPCCGTYLEMYLEQTKSKLVKSEDKENE